MADEPTTSSQMTECRWDSLKALLKIVERGESVELRAEQFKIYRVHDGTIRIDFPPLSRVAN